MSCNFRSVFQPSFLRILLSEIQNIKLSTIFTLLGIVQEEIDCQKENEIVWF